MKQLAPVLTWLALGALFAVPEISSADPLSTAVLGGSPDAFEQQSGPHNDHSDVAGGTLHFSRCPNSNIDQLIVTFLGGSAAIILRQSCGPQRPVAELTAEARSFMPEDATAGPRFNTSQGEPAKQFIAPSLAGTLDASWFQDCDGSPLVPGTYSLLITGSDWMLGVGTCP